MNFLFYFLTFFSIFFTVLVLYVRHPMYMLLFFILSLFSISGIFFLIGDFFVGAIEIIIYAGAIMVLFLFILMLINIKKESKKKIFKRKKILYYIILIIFLVCFFCYNIFFLLNYWNIKFFYKTFSLKSIGIYLFRKHLYIVELSSLILFTATILVCFFITIYKKNLLISKQDK
ncbi:NADH-quinone oxidoreductase subunit J family protein [Buchnera aphidicola]|uniref:NADH-quinone oxidoreductase subunit J family protein n=1 Tax=Buchnera aphidicola TaxID=9 RepID=UPI0031B6DA1F